MAMQEEKKLGFLGKLKLKLHLGICSACRLFQIQTSFIRKQAHKAHEHSDACLSEEQKQRIQAQLEQL
jgi:hypothetical protein